MSHYQEKGLSKIRCIHLKCKVVNKCLNVRERVEIVEVNKGSHSLTLPYPTYVNRQRL